MSSVDAIAPSSGLITRALAKYLTEDKDLTGHTAYPFEQPQTIDGMVCNNRNDARRWIRSLVAGHVYARRVPQKSTAHTAITIGLLARNKMQALVGECGVVDSTLQVTVLTRGATADHRATVLGQLLTLAISNYRGWWDDTYVHNVEVERDDDVAEEPTDGSDNWPWMWSMDITVGHDTTAPRYSPKSLVARVRVIPRTAGVYAFSAFDSTVPDGATVTNVTWVFRNTSGTQVFTFGGVPGTTATAVGVDGTNYEAAVSGLPAAGSVELTLTDSTGATSFAEGVWP